MCHLRLHQAQGRWRPWRRLAAGHKQTCLVEAKRNLRADKACCYGHVALPPLPPLLLQCLLACITADQAAQQYWTAAGFSALRRTVQSQHWEQEAQRFFVGSGVAVWHAGNSLVRAWLYGGPVRQ